MTLFSRLKLIFAGISGAIVINTLFSVFIREFSSYFAAVISAIFMGALCAFWFNEKRLRFWHKLRLVSFGVSAASFIYAIYDILKFASTYGPNSILVYNGPPYFTIGGISFFSILFSFAVGGFFSLIAGAINLHEQKDLRELES